MSHEQTPLATYRDFGGISSCSCGLYHIHLPGVTVHLNENGFDILVQMVLLAEENRDLQRKDQTESLEKRLQLVKRS